MVALAIKLGSVNAGAGKTRSYTLAISFIKVEATNCLQFAATSDARVGDVTLRSSILLTPKVLYEIKTQMILATLFGVNESQLLDFI